MTSEDAIKYHIPTREFINIEYPGRVNNYQKAFNNLGGVPTLEKVNESFHVRTETLNILFSKAFYQLEIQSGKSRS
jgi:hypothetical protein